MSAARALRRRLRAALCAFQQPDTETGPSLAERIAAIEAWQASCAEEIVTKVVRAAHSIKVGGGQDPRIVMSSSPAEGYAGITGYADGDTVGFALDAAMPLRPCPGWASPKIAYGSLDIYGPGAGPGVARRQVQIGDGVSVTPDGPQRISLTTHEHDSAEITVESDTNGPEAVQARIAAGVEADDEGGSYVGLSRGGNTTVELDDWVGVAGPSIAIRSGFDKTLAELKADGITCRHVSVVDEEGVERVELSARGLTGEVVAKAEDGCSVRLYSGDAVPGNMGLCFMRDGDSTSFFDEEDAATVKRPAERPPIVVEVRDGRAEISAAGPAATVRGVS